MREGVKPHPFAFPRAERLPNKREAEILFRQGTRLFSFPYRAQYLVGAEGETGIKTVFIAPKRLCKLSVDRHAHKRRMREAYRLQAMGLRQVCERRNLHLTIAVIVVDCGRGGGCLRLEFGKGWFGFWCCQYAAISSSYRPLRRHRAALPPPALAIARRR